MNNTTDSTDWEEKPKHRRLPHVCPKTGRILPATEPHPPRQRFAWAHWLLPLTGALSLLWFLCRVIPKPSRASYPCVRASFPAAAGFVVWLLGVWGTMVSFRWARRQMLQERYMTACAFLAAGFVAMGLWWISPFSVQQNAQAFVPSEGLNNPMGVARGVYPGRVVWVRDPGATPWNGTTGHWWDDMGTSQTNVDNMMSLALRRLTGTTTDTAAWEVVFRHFNTNHNRGNIGYQAGETIALKINCNNTSSVTDADNHADASPHSLLALLRQLVHRAGVPQANITVYEAPNTSPTRVIPNRIFDKCNAEFPSVVFAHCTNAYGRAVVAWTNNAMAYSVSNTCGRNLPTCVVQATYLINMALLKGHSTAGVTLTAKNHYGTINTREHWFIDCDARAMGTYSPFVDLIAHPHLGGKTLLFMIDGLFGCVNVGSTINAANARWNNLFNGQWSASYFLSFDPVAIDSVGLDFLRTEFGANLGGGAATNCDNYMHEAALANNPPSGTFYTNQATGARLSSLGTHEHWNNHVEKLYSRNLGRSNGIELVRVEAPLPITTTLVPAGAAWRYLDTGTNLGTAWRATNFNDAAWRSGPAPLGYGEASTGTWPRTTNSWGLDANNKFITTYYRHAFIATNSSSTNLLLNVQRDDGIVVFLNGDEIFRQNLPGGAVTYLTTASSTVSGVDETAWYATNVSPARLLRGTNLFAVEIHQDRTNSSDIFFDLKLTDTGTVPPTALSFSRSGPDMLLAWPDTPTGYPLQTTPALAATAWSSVTNVPLPTNGQLNVRTNPVNPNSFFRLRKAN